MYSLYVVLAVVRICVSEMCLMEGSDEVSLGVSYISGRQLVMVV